MFTSHPTIERLRSFVDKLRAEVAANGRDPRSVKVITAIIPIVGRTEEEAQEKYRIAMEQTSYQGGLARFGGFTGVDMSKYPLDEEFDFEGKKYEVGIHSLVETFKYLSDIKKWTPRKLGIAMASGGLSAMPVGTAEQVADVFEKWFVEGDCDGFNMSCMHFSHAIQAFQPKKRNANESNRYLEPRKLGRCGRATGSGVTKARDLLG